jgi:hypothetical protein
MIPVRMIRDVLFGTIHYSFTNAYSVKAYTLTSGVLYKVSLLYSGKQGEICAFDFLGEWFRFKRLANICVDISAYLPKYMHRGGELQSYIFNVDVFKII